MDNESWGSTIPGSVTSGFESGSDTTGRERGTIGFTFDQFLTAEGHDHFALLIWGSDESVMLFSSDIG